MSEETVAPGVRLTRSVDKERMRAFVVLEVDLKRPGLRLESVLAKGVLEGRETVSGMARRFERTGRRVLAAVNGDYFAVSAPSGMTVNQGRLTRPTRGWSSLVFSSDNRLHIAVFRHDLSLTDPDGVRLDISLNRPRGAGSVVLYTGAYGKASGSRSDGWEVMLDPMGERVLSRSAFAVMVGAAAPFPQASPIPAGKWILSFGSRRKSDRDRLETGERLRFESRIEPDPFPIHGAVSGGPRLLRAGRVSVERAEEGQRKGFDTERHPRTAAGVTRDGGRLFLVVVDGRRPGYSMGMTLYELAELLLNLGCSEALNLDGGGSSTMVVRHRVVNRPCDPTGPRPVANALLVVDATAGKLKTFRPQDTLNK